MYLLTRILFLSWWLICWNRFQPVLWGNYFPGKASYTRTSLQNLKCRALTQATKEHEAHGAGALRSHSHCLAQLKKPESAGRTHKIVKLKSSVGNHNLKWKPNPWQAEKAETEIGCVEKVLHASRQCNWCSTWDRRISVVSSWDSSYWIWLVVLLAEGEVLKGKNTD